MKLDPVVSAVKYFGHKLKWPMFFQEIHINETDS